MKGTLVAGTQLFVCRYSVTDDPAAGATGTVQLQEGVIMPPFTYIKNIRINTISALTFNAGCTISFGIVEVGINAPATLPNFLSGTFGADQFNEKNAIGTFITQFGNCNCPKVLNPSIITMFIGGAALLTGSLTIEIDTDLVNNN
jgi:hypothetical protein